jgi:CheY-like chemotaxis protein
LEVIEAENGRQAWERIQGGTVDLAIIDYFMPVMSGAQLIRRIRETEILNSLPVIVVSVGGEAARQDSYAAGADLFLDKPVLLGQLFDSLRRLLGLQQ